MTPAKTKETEEKLLRLLLAASPEERPALAKIIDRFRDVKDRSKEVVLANIAALALELACEDGTIEVKAYLYDLASEWGERASSIAQEEAWRRRKVGAE